MNTTVTTLALAALAAIVSVGQASATESRYRDRDGYYRTNPPPSVVRERQRHKHTFDETQYYERLSEQIPFGTAAWWRQKQLENPDR